MAERRHRDRVSQLRIEAGVSPMPESVDVRQARLVQLQMESLGTMRREKISSHDYRGNLASATSMSTVEASRLSNRPGTQEFQSSQEHHGELSAWNNAYLDLQGDGTLEEDLQDINRGQTHRLRLMANQSVHENDSRRSHDGNRGRGSGIRGDRERTNRPGQTDRSTGTDSPPENHDSRGLDRPRGGGRGGRGGGHAGIRNRGSRTGRIPAGYSEDSFLASLNQEEEVSLTTSDNSLTNREAAPAQTVPAAAPATKRAATQIWDQRLASPEAFMAAARGTWPMPLALNQSATATVPQAGQSTIAPDVTMTSEEVDRNLPGPSEKKVEQADLEESAGEFTDTLISTSDMERDTESRSVGSLTSSPETVKKNPSYLYSYSKDLLGLDLGAGVGPSVTEHDGGEKFKESDVEDGIKSRETGGPLSGVLAQLTQILPIIRDELNPDSVAQLDEILNQLRGRFPEPLSSAATPDMKQVVSNEQPSTGKEVQDLPKGKVEEAIFTAASNETKRSVPSEQQSTAQAVEDVLLSKFEKRTSTAASSKASTMLNQPEVTHSEPKGRVEEETVSWQASSSRTSGKENVYRNPSTKGRQEMIIGAHLMPGRSNQHGITRGNSGASLNRRTLARPSVTDSAAKPTLALLASQFEELHVGQAKENKSVQKLATISQINSTPSSSGALPPASVNPSLFATTKQFDSNPSSSGALPSATVSPSLLGTLSPRGHSLSVEQQFSATRRESSWHRGGSDATSTRTELKDSGVGTASKDPYSKSPFIQHSTPARGSMLNRTGFFRPENQASPSMSQPAPASHGWPATSSTAQGQLEHAGPRTSVATWQNLGSVRTGPLEVDLGGLPKSQNQWPGPSSRAAPTAQPASATSAPASQSPLANRTNSSVVTNLAAIEHTSPFKTTFIPTRPSQFNRTGFYREEDSRKRSEK